MAALSCSPAKPKGAILRCFLSISRGGTCAACPHRGLRPTLHGARFCPDLIPEIHIPEGHHMTLTSKLTLAHSAMVALAACNNPRGGMFGGGGADGLGGGRVQ
jgi:hypothetical protein